MADLSTNPTPQEIQQHVQDALNDREYANAYDTVSLIAYHTHNLTDSPPVDFNNLINFPKGTNGQVLTSTGPNTRPTFQSSSNRYQIDTIFESVSRLDSTINNSGSVTVDNQGLHVVADTTSGSNIVVYLTNLLTATPVFSKNPTFLAQAITVNAPSPGLGHMFLGVGEITVSSNQLVYTKNHFGFKFVANGAGMYNIFASNGNGTSETATFTGLTANPGVQVRNYRAEMTSSQILYYVDNSLLVTHATNIPTTDKNFFVIATANDNTATNQPGIVVQYAILQLDR